MSTLLPTPMQSPAGGSGSFLPEDYIEKKVERRANLIYLTLFVIVIFGVVGAFFVTNQQWSAVKDQQEAINVRYTQAARDIELLKELEAQKAQMLGKAELTTALIEKAPRSIILAELINRMPERLTLLEVELDADRVSAAKAGRGRPTPARGANSLASSAEDTEPTAPKPVKYKTDLTVIGVAASHNQVARYVAHLQDSPLFERVELKFSERTIIDDRGMNKFRIETMLRVDADARRLDPLEPVGLNAFGETSASADDEAEEQ